MYVNILLCLDCIGIFDLDRNLNFIILAYES